jgi:hypothetical protein
VKLADFFSNQDNAKLLKANATNSEKISLSKEATTRSTVPSSSSAAVSMVSVW